MRKLVILLICLSALGFVLAVIVSLTNVFGVSHMASGFSNACTNLALIAIALSVCCKCEDKDKESNK